MKRILATFIAMGLTGPGQDDTVQRVSIVNNPQVVPEIGSTLALLALAAGALFASSHLAPRLALVPVKGRRR